MSRWRILLVASAVIGLLACSGNGPRSNVVATNVPPSPGATTRILGDFSSRDDVPVDVDIEIGRSVMGRSISVVRMGGGRTVRVLVVGCIHGDESAGTSVVRALRRSAPPDGVDLWLVNSMNPDGVAAGIRVNANGVDLNRNFPPTWEPLGIKGDWEYAGPAVASEPETRAMLSLGALVRPDLVLWYHQDLHRISPGTGRQGEVRSRYGALTGLPIIGVSGGTYTGTANRWAKSVVSSRGASFTVELGPTLSDSGATTHAGAVLAIAREFFP